MAGDDLEVDGEPLIYRDEVTAVMISLADINVTLKDILELGDPWESSGRGRLRRRPAGRRTMSAPSG
jgi:hypothetical protein